MSLFWYRFKVLKRLADTSAYPGLDEWRSIYRAFPMVLSDRQGIIRPPLRTCVDPANRIPDVSGHPQKTFEECCMERATAILEHSKKLDKPIYLLFSGGIDSTTVAVSFLRAAMPEMRARIKVVTSTDAWIENPRFIREHLLGKFEFISSRGLNNFFDGRAVLVTGELNEYYIYNTHRNAADSVVAKDPIDALIAYMEQCGISPAHSRIWAGIFEADMQHSPTPVVTFEDLLWWIRFNWTWQYCSMQALAGVNTLSAPSSIEQFHERVSPFFGTFDFQMWGIRNTDRSSRKHACRELILKYTHDDDWVRTKNKYHSLNTLMRRRKLIVGIDAHFSMLSTFESLLDYYDPNNDFRA